MPNHKRLLPLPHFRRHICSLKGLATVAAKPSVHVDCRDSDKTRGRMSTDLLDYCDDLYDSLANHFCLTQYTLQDVVWMPHADRMRSFPNPIRGSASPSNVSVFMSIVDHINCSDSRSKQSSDNDPLMSWISTTLPIYTRTVVREFPALIPSFLCMLSRLYSKIDNEQALSITDVLLSSEITTHVRNHIALSDTNYADHVNVILERTTNPIVKLEIAIRCGNVQPFQEDPDYALIIRNYQTLMCDACCCGDEAIFHCLWDLRTRVTQLYDFTFVQYLETALCASNYDAFEIILDYIICNHPDFFRLYQHLLWSRVRDIPTVQFLMKHGFTVTYSLFWVHGGATAAFLIKQGASLLPLLPDEESLWCIFLSDPAQALVIVEGWHVAKIDGSQYLRDTIQMCQEPSVLRELVRMMVQYYSEEQAIDALRHALLNEGQAYINVPYLRTCLGLCGPDLFNCRDPETGRTPLINTVRAKRAELFFYLLSAGADARIRDKAGLNALDHYNHLHLNLPLIHATLLMHMRTTSSDQPHVVHHNDMSFTTRGSRSSGSHHLHLV